MNFVGSRFQTIRHGRSRYRTAQATLIFLLVLAASGRAQTYHISTPVSGYVQVLFVDGANTSPNRPVAGGLCTLGTLDETLIYDPAADTLRQVGSLTLNTGYISSGFSESRMVGTNWLTANLSTSLYLPSYVTFDNSGQNASYEVGCDIPITGSYEVDADGQTLTGQLGYDLGLSTYTTISSVTSTSLTFQMSSGHGLADGPWMASVTASNGLDVNLIGGANDRSYYWSWSVGPVTAMVVPEPTTCALVGTGILILCAAVRRKRSR